MEEGTGLLHVAPGHGIEDYGIGIKNKLPILSPLPLYRTPWLQSAKKHSGMNEQELLNRFVAKEFDIDGERLMLALLSLS